MVLQNAKFEPIWTPWTFPPWGLLVQDLRYHLVLVDDSLSTHGCRHETSCGPRAKQG